MFARYNLFCVIVVMILCSSAFGGALSRTGGVGPTYVSNGGSIDGPWVSENLAFKTQIQDDSLEMGVEVMFPKFKLTDRFGRTLESKDIAHVLPWLSYVNKVDDDTAWGLEASTQYGLGASFEKPRFGKDSSTLVCGTYAKLYMAQDLSDEFSAGVAVIGVQSMLKWHGPLDIGRHYLPINTDTRADGFGLGCQIDLKWQPLEDLAFGLSYMSEVEVSLEGRTEILSPFQLRDEIRTRFKFPDRLTLSAAWKPTGRVLLVSDFSYYGYSKSSSDSVDIKFNKLMITKPVELNWKDHIVAHLGIDYKVSESLTIGGGVGYMSMSMPDHATDFMTPDVPGYNIAGKVSWSHKDLDLTLGVSHSWGKYENDRLTVETRVTTLCFAGSWKF